MTSLATESWQGYQIPVPRPRFQYAQPHPQSLTPDTPVPPRNEKELTRESLVTILTYFSTLVPSHFNGRPIRLVVHGGACMLLHRDLYALAQQQHHLATETPSTSTHNALPRRTSTRDVDYIHRSFVTEWNSMGVGDPGERLLSCIKLTAKRFGLGADWMNSDADVALPMARDPAGNEYDPIYAAAVQPNNIHSHTIFSAPNSMLILISVTPFWAVALKLVRYTNFDPGDICLVLRNGTKLSHVHWTPKTLEDWIFSQCWPMGYYSYDTTRLNEIRSRIHHAIQMVSSWDEDLQKEPPVIPHLMGPDRSGSANQLLAPPQPLSHVDISPWSRPLSQGPFSHGIRPHETIPDPDDPWLDPRQQAKPRGHSPWHPQVDPEVARFDRSVAAMLHESRKMLPMMLSNNDLPTVEQASRKLRDKDRSRARSNDRRSKWLMLGHDIYDSESELESDGERKSSRQQHRTYYDQDQQHQPVLPHDQSRSPWHHTRSASAEPHALTPYPAVRRTRSPSPHPLKFRRRPPPLNLDSTNHIDSLTNSFAHL